MVRSKLLLLLILMIGLASVATRTLALVQEVCGPWRWASPLPQGNTLSAVAYGRGIYVAVGQAGSVLVSGDAAEWTVARTGVTDGLAAVEWTGAGFIAVGDAGTVVLGPDGLEWTVTGVGSTDDLRAVASGGGRVVAVGRGGAIFWSADGTTWQRAASGTSVDLGAVVWSGTRFVAAEDGGVFADLTRAASLLTSPDGATWVRTPISEAMYLRALASNGSRVVAAGAYCVPPGASPDGRCRAGNLVSVSDDGGVTWSTAKLTLDAFKSVVWTGSGYLALGGGSGSGFATFTSPDGLAWAPTGGGSANLVASMGVGEAGLVAVGVSGCILTSRDGRDWVSVLTSDSRSDLLDVVWTGTQFVAVGPGSSASPAFVKVSPDGVVWTGRASEAFTGRGGLSGVAWSGSTLAAIGDTYIAESRDGVEWSVVANWDSQALFRLSSIAWTGTRFVAVGSRLHTNGGIEGLVVASSDGVTWSEVYVQPGVRFRGVAGSGGITVVTGFEPNSTFTPHLCKGTDANYWQEVPGLSLTSIGPVTWAGTEFVLLGGSPPRAYASRDGLTWVERGLGAPDGLYRMVWDGRELVGVGAYGVTARSADGSVWSSEFAGTWYSLSGVAAGDGPTIAVGQSGTVMSRECVDVPRARRHVTRLPGAPGPAAAGRARASS